MYKISFSSNFFKKHIYAIYMVCYQFFFKSITIKNLKIYEKNFKEQ